jgi:hypothetical protein
MSNICQQMLERHHFYKTIQQFLSITKPWINFQSICCARFRYLHLAEMLLFENAAEIRDESGESHILYVFTPKNWIYKSKKKNGTK